jgi:hypothetical protein
MIEGNFFTYSKLSTTCNDQFDRLLRELQFLIDKKDWDPARHDALLRAKVRNKIQTIRATMLDSGELVRQGKSFFLNVAYRDEEGNGVTADASHEDLATVRDLIGQLPPQHLPATLRLIFDRMDDASSILLQLAEWINIRQGQRPS